ncbi:SPX domain-containing protein [Hortaea werneckii]|nr:SPX domain-containing protein [Hortaea werneckii]
MLPQLPSPEILVRIHCPAILNPHQPKPNRNNNPVTQHTSRDTPSQEIPNPQVPPPRRRVLHHNRRHVRETRSRETHSSRSHKDGGHDEEVRVGGREGRADFADQREDDKGGHGVGDEGGDDGDEGGEGAVAMVVRRPEEVTALPRARPPAARMMMVQRKLLKSSLVRMPVPKKARRGKMAMTPIGGCEAVFHWSDRDDGCAAVGTECNEEEDPDQEKRDDAHWEGDEEPDAPARLRFHILEGNEVLRAGDGGGGTADIGGEGDAEEKSLGHGAVRREVAENGLIKKFGN